MLTHLIVVGTIALCGALFLRAWTIDSQRALIFTPFLIFVFNDLTWNWVAAVFAPVIGLSTDHYAFVVISGSFVAFLIGFAIGLAALRYGTSTPVRFQEQQLLVTRADKEYIYVVVALALLLSVIGLYFFRGVPPLMTAIRSLLLGADADLVARSIDMGRFEYSKSHYFDGEYRGQGVFGVILRIGWTYLCGLTFAVYLQTKARIWIYVTGATVCGAFVFVAGEGSRAPFLWIIVYLLVVFSLMRRVTVRSVVVVLVTTVSLLVGLSIISPKLRYAVHSENFVQQSSTNLGSRLFFGNGGNTVRAIELVRSGSWDHRYGELHVRSFISILPGVGGEPFAFELFQTINPWSRATTFATPTYHAELYVDFGVPGTVVGYFGLGMLLAVAQRLLLRLPKTPLFLPLVAYFFLVLGRMPITGLTAIASSLVVALPLWFGARMLYSILLAPSSFGGVRGRATPMPVQTSAERH